MDEIRSEKHDDVSNSSNEENKFITCEEVENSAEAANGFITCEETGNLSNKEKAPVEKEKKKKVSKRAIKNTVMIVVLIGMLAAMTFTVGLVGGHHGGPVGNGPGGGPQTEQSADGNMQPPSDSGQGSSENAQPPSDSGQGSSENAQPPSDSGQGSSENAQPPSYNGQRGAMKGGKANGVGGKVSRMGPVRIILLIFEALIFGANLVYLILSRMNKKSFKETFAEKKRAVAFALATVLVGCGISAAGVFLPGKIMRSIYGGPGQVQGEGNSEPEAEADNVVDGGSETLNKTYETTDADRNVILVKNGGTLTSAGATINKASGDGSNVDNCDFYGINAALLVNSKSEATVKNAEISTSASMSNAVFCTGEGSEIDISDSSIKTTGERSCRGLDATYGGTINADNVTVATEGNSSAAVATDRGEGTVKVTASTLSTEGTGSPVIYSTGAISVSKTEGTATGSQCVVVEGKNSATLKNSSITASGAGNRGDVDVCGVMLYQSMSGDAEEGTSTFTADSSALSVSEDSNYYESAPMFFVTNTDAEINLSNTELNFGSGILLSAKGTDQWGETDSNGGNVKLVADNQKLSGDTTADSISEVAITLKNGSTYKGAINNDNKAKSVKLVLSADSKLVLTADTYVTSLEDKDSTYSNIDFNGHKLFVNGKAVSA